ncbi:DUF1508 domain-containing protein [Motiliproteus coralliicola]|uniref:DUF1508 domain-containing protein n=1 Tax=Motiliproteus coralliicola TaxID=2283196 RepID=A0A369WYV0_9GAMM|nr:YegP family protein [Motiliproteus coralliicola]RDE24685.1 DUF1508 domain-containing protein [Motiliproteus coralliicola]
MTDLHIDPKTPIDPSLDVQQLYDQGISQLIELSSEIWSDYNRHDPGITLLEVISYLLTELSYRMDWPITDILVDGLADTDAAQKRTLMSQHFPGADRVLPAAPLTETDYRKLLIDLPNVQNAWVDPLPLSLYLDCRTGRTSLKAVTGSGIKQLQVAGGYQVRLELAAGLNAAAKAESIARVEQLLNSRRNLCEWFTPPKPIAKQNFILCGEFEIAPKADPQQVFVEVMLAVHNYLQAPIQQQSAQNSLDSTNNKANAETDWADVLFNGPLLRHGPIGENEIEQAALKTEIRLSDLINLIMDIESVVAVRELVINPENLKQPLDNPWIVPVADGKKAVLKPQGGNLAFYKRQLAVFCDKTAALALLNNRIKQQQQQPVDYSVDYPIAPQPGQSREIERYQTVQTELPAIYGLGQAGLPGNASPQRKAQVLQLRGYLAFIDQLAANFLSQAHQLRELLSLDDQQQASYFGQLPTSITDWRKLYGEAPEAEANLQQLISDPVVDLERRNRLLDFMVARFGEDLTELTDVMLNAFGLSPLATLRYKGQFHQQVAELSRDRGMAHDVSLKRDYWNSDNVSGLEKRLCRLLGIADHRRRNLGDVAFDIYAELDSTPGDEFRFRIRNRDDASILLSSSTRYASKKAARAEMRLAILFGMLPSHYVMQRTKNGRFYFNLVDDSGEIIARRIEYFDTEQQARDAIEQVVDNLSVNYSSEGLYLIEHSLLLPQSDEDPQLPVCVNDGCDDCIDPYSYQIQLILPAYGARFANQEFRRYCESVIRAEVPAHIMPRVCWIDQQQMALLEKAYRDWLGVLHGASSVDPQLKKQRLIDALGSINNVYPVEQLHDCKSDQSGFVIGRTALGTFKESL